MDKRIIADPRAHYGSGRFDTWTFIVQRLTGACNAAFTGFLAWLVVRLAGAERAEMVSVVAHPLVGLLLCLLLVSVSIHMWIGVREIIEDYVHEPRVNRLSLGLNTFYAAAIAIVGIASVVKLVFWG